MGVVSVRKNDAGKINVTFPYSPDFIAKVKSIPGHRWHPDDKCWSFPHTNGIMAKILKVFEGEEIRIDSVLQSQLSTPVIARHPEPVEGPKQSSYNFEDLRREMISRKYSHKTVKAYLYFNRNFFDQAGNNHNAGLFCRAAGRRGG